MIYLSFWEHFVKAIFTLKKITSQKEALLDESVMKFS